MRPVGSPAELERRRLRAMDLLDRGIPVHAVADRVGVDRRSVRRWKRVYRRRGRRALAAQPASGRPPKLTSRQRQALVRKVLKGPQAAGYQTALWTCARIAEFVRAEFGVRYHPDHVGRLLRRCGLTPQRPRRRAKERDEERIQQWARGEWAQVKKTGAPGRSLGLRG